MRIRPFTLIALCAVATGLSACSAHPSDAPLNDGLPEVTVVTLSDQSLALARELPGRVRPFLMAEVRPQVNGIIKQRLFVEGSYVKAGQPLYEIDDAIYRAQYESAQATLRRTQATWHAAQLAAARSDELLKIKAESVQDNESADAAQAQAKADVAAAQAAVDTAKVNLAYAHITAPISGYIGESRVTQGALVAVNQESPLAVIQQIDPIYVDVNEPSSDWLALKQAMDQGRIRAGAEGAQVNIQLENGTVYSSPGKLQFADVSVDTSTGNVLLRALVPNPKSELLPGMYVRAKIDQGVVPGAILVPQEGITRDRDGHATALVVDKDGKVQTRTLRASRTVGNQWLVEQGLVAGDKVVVAGQQNVEPGMKVQAVEQAAVVADSNS
jgi:membrane fusion protein (multidrug efflux system)